jgi:hypothetical protein
VGRRENYVRITRLHPLRLLFGIQLSHKSRSICITFSEDKMTLPNSRRVRYRGITVTCGCGRNAPAYTDATKRNSKDGGDDDARNIRLLSYFPLGPI